MEIRKQSILVSLIVSNLHHRIDIHWTNIIYLNNIFSNLWRIITYDILTHSKLSFYNMFSLLYYMQYNFYSLQHLSSFHLILQFIDWKHIHNIVSIYY